jgi:hypothetical protein
MNPKCAIGPSSLAGIGVFATQVIEESELVAIWGGIIYSAAEIGSLGNLYPHFRSHPFEVAEGFFMGSTSNTAIDDAERFNHSCSPNVGIKGQVVVLARRLIEPGEELTFDYETTDIAPDPFTCCCNTARCRSRIDGGRWQCPEFQRENAGWFSWFIAEKIAAISNGVHSDGNGCLSLRDL